MEDISTVDGFVEITECVAEMLKYLANEPSVGLFYVQQHTQNSVPNLVNLRNSVEDKSREMTLHTEDSGESIVMLSSMKECGSPIVDDMISDIKNSLTIMSSKQPKRGLINNPRSLFQMGRSSSWGPAAWGRNEAPLEPEAESSSSYISTVFKSAKERAASLKWVQSDSDGSVHQKDEYLPSVLDTTLQFTVPSTSSAMPNIKVEEPMLSTLMSLRRKEKPN
ncbi:BLOC-1-related complex subunit like [Heracleum sosnowskyi]|uniref:BLOC-1-related complex subunit like n=1 Tax=Heracleum sosnowskyi TaxID=360622 RepID=A0AAD8GL69_9APIA|nr:BLOC-1-related complex subunit like [Heracleum sosnowskyi]KAK1396459.1 BLOC-1-related complex subunit like [Heracleum sosnowskyi]